MCSEEPTYLFNLVVNSTRSHLAEQCDKHLNIILLMHIPLFSLRTGLNKKAVSRVNSMPNIGTHARQVKAGHKRRSVIERNSTCTPRVPLEVGSMVEVVSNSRVTVYGVIRWLGVPAGKTEQWAGIELVRG